MMIRINRNENVETLAPLCCRRTLQEVRFAGKTYGELLLDRWERSVTDPGCRKVITAPSAFWPSVALLSQMAAIEGNFVLADGDSKIIAWKGDTEELPKNAETVSMDSASFLVQYPWDVLKINEEIVGALKENSIAGTIREGVFNDGVITLGEGSVILPGVYIEGAAVIGKNCKIGPNCYLRGCNSIGDNCHIGQAVEIKNSILMDKVAAGHLSYIGDSIVCPHVNFGAGSIISNFRHDGKNHRSMVCGQLVDTGRRKFGSIIGDNVHTGIHSSIYPGRKLWPDVQLLPGEVVKYDILS